MSEIYLRDIRIPKESNGRCHRRTASEITDILTGIIPRPPKSMRQVSLGFTIEYSTDDADNYFLKLEIINKLRDQKLTARLSYNTQL